MTEHDYLQTYYPRDVICINDAFFPLPQGAAISVEHKEIASTFTTADGSKRKDVIKAYKAVTITFSFLTQKDYEALCTMRETLEAAGYDDVKALFLRKETMPNSPLKDSKSLFERISIDLIQPFTYRYTFRKNGLFLYSDVTVKIN